MQTGGLARLCHVLELQHRANLGEGRRRPHHWYKRDLLLELLTEANEERVDKGAIIHMIADLPNFIVDGLDALTEDSDRRVPLRDGAELRVQRVDSSVTVILKELTKRAA